MNETADSSSLVLHEGVNADVLNRFFGQKSKENPKQDTGAAQERVEEDSVTEQRFNPFKNSLNRTRQIFSRMGESFKDILSQMTCGMS